MTLGAPTEKDECLAIGMHAQQYAWEVKIIVTLYLYVPTGTVRDGKYAGRQYGVTVLPYVNRANEKICCLSLERVVDIFAI